MTIRFTITSLRKIRMWAGVTALAILASTVLPAMSALAISEEELYFYGQNNILFYDPTCSRLIAEAGDIVVMGETMEEKIWSGLTSFMTDEQAAGAMGNMAHEGSFNPVLHEQLYANSGIDIFTDTRYSYGVGLIQWSWKRRTDMLDNVLASHPELKKYFTGHSYNKNFTSGDTFFSELKKEVGDEEANTVANALVALELAYLQVEMNNSRSMDLSPYDWKEYFSITNVDDAANYFLRKIEQPNHQNEQEPLRKADAWKYYNELSGKQITAGGSSMSSSNSCVSSAALVDGGFGSKEEAEAALITAYKADNLSGLTLAPTNTGDRHDNCVAFSTWFVDRMTSIVLPEGKIGGNGEAIAQNLYNGWVGRYPALEISNTPTVYSVASWRVAGPFTPSGNHTGVVVGINQENNKILIAEAAYDKPWFTGVHEYNLSDAMDNPNYYYVNVNAYLSGL